MSSMVANSRTRVEENTSEEINQRIRQDTQKRIEFYQNNKALIGDRLRQLDREWDIERAIEVNAPVLALISLFLGGIFRFLAYLVLGFLLQHAIQGWCPPIPVFRNFGVRTQTEINEERMALKAVRGDFDQYYSKNNNPLASSETAPSITATQS